MAELKIDENLIVCAQQQLLRCQNKVSGAIDALVHLRNHVCFFSKGIQRVEDDYRSLFCELAQFCIMDYYEGGIRKYALIYDNISITSDTEYKRRMKEFKRRVYGIGLHRDCYDFIRSDTNKLFETLESADNVVDEENKEE